MRERRARWFYFLAPVDDPHPRPARYRARMQFYGGEDPGTGAAAGCAISHLVRRGAVPSAETICVHQGVEIGRPSDLFVSARRVDGRVSEVCLGGSTVPVAVGRLFLH